MQIDHPVRIGNDGRTAATTLEDHIRDMIEQVLFTTPGERVNRPSFGSGLLQMVFAPNSDVQATTLQSTIPAAIQQWLGDVVQIQNVEVTNVEATLDVTVRYVIRQTQQPQVAVFSRSI
ncbi:MAG: GPW/gp25 family protein [Deltaproteobacteria bacterium]